MAKVTGDAVRVVPQSAPVSADDTAERVRLFDEATERQRHRSDGRKQLIPRDRGWSREQLYVRGRSH